MTDSAESRQDALKPSRTAGTRTSTVIAGTYRLLQKLGSGAMGEVYDAEHIRLGRHVAVKLLRADSMDDHRAVKRFQSETRALATVRSDHIVSVLDCGELEDGTPYIVMELLDGEDLRRLLERSKPLALRRAAHLALGACRGLSVVHAAGIVHRDLKPANLFVARGSRGEEVCKILDFGVAKLVGSDSTHQGALLGTIRYMAPEQIRSGKDVGPASDVYAIGAILYECLAGISARTTESREELMFEILSGPPVRLSKHCPSIPAPLESLVMKALASEPADRFESADAMAEELEAVLAGAARVDATEPDSSDVFERGHSSRDRVVRSINRHRPKIVAGAAVLGLAIGWFARSLSEQGNVEVVAAPAPEPAKAALLPEARAAEPIARSTQAPPEEPSTVPSLPVSSAVPSVSSGVTILPSAQRSGAPARRPSARSSTASHNSTTASAPGSGIDVSSPYSSDVKSP